MLTGRTQLVKFKHSISKIMTVKSDVAQGLHLGPLLFLIFINDICLFINHSGFPLFADDLKLYRMIYDNEDRVSLQNDLNSVSSCCLENIMELNVKKCCSISFEIDRLISSSHLINNILINNVEEVRDLGVMVDNKLSFNSHIDYITNLSIK